MFGTRKLTPFSDTKLENPEPILIHKTFDPQDETDDRVRFDIRSIAGATHMSSTMFIERRVRAKVSMPSTVAEKYTIGDGYVNSATRVMHGVSGDDHATFIRKPGFVIQENMKRMNFSFNGGDVHSDTEWLAPYAKLYEKSFKPFIRSSGRTFANQNDRVVRKNARMSDQLDIYRNQDQSISGTYYMKSECPYIHPERNDRRQNTVAGANIENVHAGQPRVAWYDENVFDNNQMEWHMGEDPNGFNEPLYNISLFRPQRPGPNVAQTAVNQFNYVSPNTEVLTSVTPMSHVFFTDYYSNHWETEDKQKLAAFVTARDQLYQHGVLIQNYQADANRWNTLKLQYAQVFQTRAQANARDALFGGADATWVDTMGHWGVDLRRPCYDYPQNPAANSTKKLFLRTAAAMLQFADEIQRWHKFELEDNNQTRIYDVAARLAFLNQVIEAPDGIAYKFDVLQDAIESEYDEVDPDYDQIDRWSNTRDGYIPYLTAHELPYEHVPDLSDEASSDDYLTVVQQIEEQINDQQADLDGLLAAFRFNNQAYHIWDWNDQDRSYIGVMQRLSRWVHWYDADVNKDERTNILKPTCQYIDATFIEPCMLGPCKPSEYSNIGCYAKNSTIIPYVERFQLDMIFRDRKNQIYFECDSHEKVHMDAFRGEIFRPTLEIETLQTKLHCVFVEKPVPLPATLPYLDVRTERLATVSLLKDNAQEIKFDDIDMRREWKYVMVYCKMRKPREFTAQSGLPDFPDTDKSAAVTAVTFSTDIQQNCLVASSRERVNAMTVRNFPEFMAPVGKTGGVLGVVFNEFSQRKKVAEGYNHLRGEVSIEQDWSDVPIEVDVFISFFRTDVLLEIHDHFAKGTIHMM